MAVLQTQQASLEATMRELQRLQSDGFAQMNAKMDRVNEVASSIALVQAQQQQHGDGLNRAFNDIRATNQRLQVLSEDYAALDRKANFAKGGLYVLGAVGGIVIALVVWGITPWFDAVKEAQRESTQLRLEVEKLKMERTP